eukprot:GFYU01024803.1.p1 GENE.GFYU01024803.1~~GFYU01024803.1.p1  ORF type:complete len:133 (+),score=7.74 GFYU01024803.1:28-426(+)
MSHNPARGAKIEDFDCVGQSSIDARQRELEVRHAAYLQEHPELGEVLQDFMQSLLVHKPDDALAFTTQYFKDIHLLPDGAAATPSADDVADAAPSSSSPATTAAVNITTAVEEEYVDQQAEEVADEEEVNDE